MVARGVLVAVETDLDRIDPAIRDGEVGSFAVDHADVRAAFKSESTVECFDTGLCLRSRWAFRHAKRERTLLRLTVRTFESSRPMSVPPPITLLPSMALKVRPSAALTC